jgi:hypothetical protein
LSVTKPDGESAADTYIVWFCYFCFVPLSPEDVEAVARRVLELLRNERPSTFKLVDARELAGLLGVSVHYVYEHAAELGVLRLGSGRKARIRFDANTARQALESRRRRPDGLGTRAASRG